MGASIAGRFQKAKKDAQGNVLSQGSLETWVRKDESSSQEWNFEKLWVRSFPAHANCLYWCEDKNYLLVGLDNGFIVPIEINVDEPTTYTELRDYKIHTSRVTGIYLDSERDLMFSVGEDKNLRVFDFQKKAVTSSKHTIR